MSINHIIRRICNLRIEEIILIGDSMFLLDYEHQFIRNLHVMDSRS